MKILTCMALAGLLGALAVPVFAADGDSGDAALKAAAIGMTPVTPQKTLPPWQRFMQQTACLSPLQAR